MPRGTPHVDALGDVDPRVLLAMALPAVGVAVKAAVGPIAGMM